MYRYIIIFIKKKKPENWKITKKLCKQTFILTKKYIRKNLNNVKPEYIILSLIETLFISYPGIKLVLSYTERIKIKVNRKVLNKGAIIKNWIKLFYIIKRVIIEISFVGLNYNKLPRFQNFNIKYIAL